MTLRAWILKNISLEPFIGSPLTPLFLRGGGFVLGFLPVFSFKCIRERLPGLLQHMLTVLVFWSRVLLMPRLPSAARSSPPPVQKRDAQHMFLQHRGSHAEYRKNTPNKRRGLRKRGLVDFSLAWKLQSRLKCSILTFRIPHQEQGPWWLARLKCSISLRARKKAHKLWTYKLFASRDNPPVNQREKLIFLVFWGEHKKYKLFGPVHPGTTSRSCLGHLDGNQVYVFVPFFSRIAWKFRSWREIFFNLTQCKNLMYSKRGCL